MKYLDISHTSVRELEPLKSFKLLEEINLEATDVTEEEEIMYFENQDSLKLIILKETPLYLRLAEKFDSQSEIVNGLFLYTDQCAEEDPSQA